jgi:hypothetical protein
VPQRAQKRASGRRFEPQLLQTGIAVASCNWDAPQLMQNRAPRSRGARHTTQATVVGSAAGASTTACGAAMVGGAGSTTGAAVGTAITGASSTGGAG